MEGLIVLAVLAAPLLLVLFWWVAVYNRIVGVRQHLRESWSDIEIELRRRLDLIPALVETAKGYAAHEQAVMETVARLRSMQSDPEHARSRGEDERRVESAAHRIVALAESYPELQADQQFLALQQELTETEDRIAAARRFYNANVRDLNQLREQFPSNVVASAAGIQQAEYFQREYE